jgi:hypothetical protein
MLLLVQYAVTCHALHHFNKLPINVILMLVLAISFITRKFYFKDFFKLAFGIIWGEMYEYCHYRTEFSFKLQIISVFERTR